MLHTINAHGGYELELPDGDHIGRRLSTGRPYEPWVLRVAGCLVSRGGLFVDVGAHAGNHTLFMATGGAQVLAIEPHPETCALLRANVERNQMSDRVRVINAALGDATGRGSVAIPDPVNTGSAVVTFGEGDIEVTTLDSLDVVPELIKIDVEGGEEAVLAGAAETLRRSKPALLMERHAGSLDRQLRQFGYRRIGGALAASPTFLYVARWRQLKGAGWAIAGASRQGVTRFRHSTRRMEE